MFMNVILGAIIVAQTDTVPTLLEVITVHVYQDIPGLVLTVLT